MRTEYCLALTGFDIVTVLLNHYQNVFQTIIVFTRSASSPKAQLLATRGAQIREIDTSSNHKDFRHLFHGVDALVETLAHYNEDIKLRLFRAALDAGVKVYFPSEFGMYVVPFDHSMSTRLTQRIDAVTSTEAQLYSQGMSIQCGRQEETYRLCSAEKRPRGEAPPKLSL